jgi:hypothetical protein
MSQRSVERAVGKLVTDEKFRRDFLEDAERASRRADLDLSPEELDALRRVPLRTLAELGAQLDGRICRVHIPGNEQRG